MATATPAAASPASAATGMPMARDVIFAPLAQALGEYMEPTCIERVAQAYAFSKQAHEGQLRVSGEPYITHPVAVAEILAGLRLDEKTIIAALLHDVIEDTPTARDQIAAEYGDEVAHLVDGVSKL
ncbi:MAG: HD domain-containing protein, partial [Halothiobacillaceae bacterium]